MGNNKSNTYSMPGGEYGITDLKSTHAFEYIDQGGGQYSNDVEFYKNSDGWYGVNDSFKDIDYLDQEAVNKRSKEIEKENEQYIRDCKKKGTYGKKKPNIELTVKHCPLYDDPTPKINKSDKPIESYRMTMLDMSKDSKYYTPSIEEFYPGFEYELHKEFEKDAWETVIYEGQLLIHDAIDQEWASYDSIDDYIEEQIVRVKYLDKEDIESLGFIKFESFDNFGEIYGQYRKNTVRIYINPLNGFPKVTIHKLELDEVERTLFKGTIKNKSELKVLLKQLGIKDE